MSITDPRRRKVDSIQHCKKRQRNAKRLPDPNAVRCHRQLEEAYQYLFRTDVDQTAADQQRRKNRQQENLQQLTIMQPAYLVFPHTQLPQNPVLPLFLLPVAKYLRRQDRSAHDLQNHRQIKQADQHGIKVLNFAFIQLFSRKIILIFLTKSCERSAGLR